MKNILSAIFIVVILLACNSRQSGINNENDSLQVKKLSIEKLEDSAANYIDKTVEVTGLVTHVCKHGGKRLHLTGQDPIKKIVVITGDKIDYFDATIEGKDVVIKGFMRETRIDEEYLTEWEQELADAGEDSISHDDKTHAADHESAFEKIKNMRETLKTSEKGYLSDFWIECNEIKVLD